MRKLILIAGRLGAGLLLAIAGLGIALMALPAQAADPAGLVDFGLALAAVRDALHTLIEGLVAAATGYVIVWMKARTGIDVAADARTVVWAAATRAADLALHRFPREATLDTGSPLVGAAVQYLTDQVPAAIGRLQMTPTEVERLAVAHLAQGLRFGTATALLPATVLADAAKT